jgi:hypothetical protein
LVILLYKVNLCENKCGCYEQIFPLSSLQDLLVCSADEVQCLGDLSTIVMQEGSIEDDGLINSHPNLLT